MQDSSPNSLSSAARRQQQPAVGLAGEAVPAQVWQLCGVPANLQATSMVATADALLQLDSVHCPLEVVTCLQHADQAIAQAVGHVRQSSSFHRIHSALSQPDKNGADTSTSSTSAVVYLDAKAPMSSNDRVAAHSISAVQWP